MENIVENLFIKSVFNKIRKEIELQSIGEKELCTKCIDRIEKKFLLITSEKGMKK